MKRIALITLFVLGLTSSGWSSPWRDDSRHSVWTQVCPMQQLRWDAYVPPPQPRRSSDFALPNYPSENPFDRRWAVRRPTGRLE